MFARMMLQMKYLFVAMFDRRGMESVSRPCIGDVRDHVTCGLCHGYLVDAVTVVRCLHTCEYNSENMLHSMYYYVVWISRNHIVVITIITTVMHARYFSICYVNWLLG